MQSGRIILLMSLPFLVCGCFKSSLDVTVSQFQFNERDNPARAAMAEQGRLAVVRQAEAATRYTAAIEAQKKLVSNVNSAFIKGDSKVVNQNAVDTLSGKLDSLFGDVTKLTKQAQASVITQSSQPIPFSGFEEFDIRRRNALAEAKLDFCVVDAACLEDPARKTAIEEDENIRQSLAKLVNVTGTGSDGAVTVDQAPKVIQNVVQELEKSEAKVAEANADLKAASNVATDGISRRHEVYQDFSDPAWSLINQGKGKWKRMSSPAKAELNGDTEMVLVFEEGLSPRWRHVNADPSSVIYSNARMINGALKQVSAVAGAVLGTYGINLGDLGVKDPGATGTETTTTIGLRVHNLQIQQQRDSLKLAINAVQVEAQATLDAIDSANEDPLKQAAAKNRLPDILSKLNTLKVLLEKVEADLKRPSGESNQNSSPPDATTPSDANSGSSATVPSTTSSPQSNKNTPNVSELNTQPPSPQPSVPSTKP